MFLDQFGDFMILVLIAAAVTSGAIGEFSDAIAIIVIVILNAVLGFIQEYRAEKAMTALKKMAALTATVIREAKTTEIEATELVPGDNLRKIIKYLLSSNSGEIWTLFLAPFFRVPMPLLPIQIHWINLMTDALPAIALSAEPVERDVMERPPRHPKEGVFVNGLGFYCIWVGLVMASATLAAQAWSIHVPGSHWQTMVFTVLCLSQFGNALAVRSEKESFFRIGPLSNKYLLGAVILSFFFQMATIYVPLLNPVFKTQPLSLNELLLTIGLSSIVFLAAEGQKWWKRRIR